jgi:excisionase family DNA binding protein
MSKVIIFTTGEVARICVVAPRTVSKWFDTGHLKGYRLPGSQDRRIPEEYLRRFLNEKEGLHPLLPNLDEEVKKRRDAERSVSPNPVLK